MQGRTFGERLVGAFLGALFGLLLGAGIMVAFYVVDPSGRLGLKVLWATVAYCSVFTFIFGEALGDVITMFHRIYLVVRGIRMDDFSGIDPEASWMGPIVMFFLFIVPLAIVIYLVVK